MFVFIFTKNIIINSDKITRRNAPSCFSFGLDRGAVYSGIKNLFVAAAVYRGLALRPKVKKFYVTFEDKN